MQRQPKAADFNLLDQGPNGARRPGSGRPTGADVLVAQRLQPRQLPESSRLVADFMGEDGSLLNTRRLASDAKADGSLAPIQSAVVPLSGKGVSQAQSCLGCAEAAIAVYKNKICRLPPLLSDAVERPKSEPRPDPLRLNRRVLSECAAITGQSSESHP